MVRLHIDWFRVKKWAHYNQNGKYTVFQWQIIEKRITVHSGKLTWSLRGQVQRSTRWTGPPSMHGKFICPLCTENNPFYINIPPYTHKEWPKLTPSQVKWQFRDSLIVRPKWPHHVRKVCAIDRLAAESLAPLRTPRFGFWVSVT